jgi:hypothetical protein
MIQLKNIGSKLVFRVLVFFIILLFIGAVADNRNMNLVEVLLPKFVYSLVIGIVFILPPFLVSKTVLQNANKPKLIIEDVVFLLWYSAVYGLLFWFSIQNRYSSVSDDSDFVDNASSILPMTVAQNYFGLISIAVFYIVVKKLLLKFLISERS